MEISGFSLVNGMSETEIIEKLKADPDVDKKLLKAFTNIDGDDIVNNEKEFNILEEISAAKEKVAELRKNSDVERPVFGKILNDTIVTSERKEPKLISKEKISTLRAILDFNAEKKRALEIGDLDAYNELVKEEYGDHAPCVPRKYTDIVKGDKEFRISSGDVWVWESFDEKTVTNEHNESQTINGRWRKLKGSNSADKAMLKMVEAEIWAEGISPENAVDASLCNGFIYDKRSGYGHDSSGNWYQYNAENNLIVRIDDRKTCRKIENKFMNNPPMGDDCGLLLDLVKNRTSRA